MQQAQHPYLPLTDPQWLVRSTGMHFLICLFSSPFSRSIEARCGSVPVTLALPAAETGRSQVGAQPGQFSDSVDFVSKTQNKMKDRTQNTEERKKEGEKGLEV